MSTYESLSPQFLSADHRHAFFRALNGFRPSQQNSSEYQAALFICTSNDEFIEKMLPYLTPDGFKLQKMFELEDFSSGHLKMAKLAANLYNGTHEEPIVDTIASLDKSMFHTLLQALIVRRYGVKIQ